MSLRAELMDTQEKLRSAENDKLTLETDIQVCGHSRVVAWGRVQRSAGIQRLSVSSALQGHAGSWLGVEKRFSGVATQPVEREASVRDNPKARHPGACSWNVCISCCMLEEPYRQHGTPGVTCDVWQ